MVGSRYIFTFEHSFAEEWGATSRRSFLRGTAVDIFARDITNSWAFASASELQKTQNTERNEQCEDATHIVSRGLRGVN